MILFPKDEGWRKWKACEQTTPMAGPKRQVIRLQNVDCCSWGFPVAGAFNCGCTCQGPLLQVHQGVCLSIGTCHHAFLKTYIVCFECRYVLKMYTSQIRPVQISLIPCCFQYIPCFEKMHIYIASIPAVVCETSHKSWISQCKHIFSEHII